MKKINAMKRKVPFFIILMLLASSVFAVLMSTSAKAAADKVTNQAILDNIGIYYWLPGYYKLELLENGITLRIWGVTNQIIKDIPMIDIKNNPDGRTKLKKDILVSLYTFKGASIELVCIEGAPSGQTVTCKKSLKISDIIDNQLILDSFSADFNLWVDGKYEVKLKDDDPTKVIINCPGKAPKIIDFKSDKNLLKYDILRQIYTKCGVTSVKGGNINDLIFSTQNLGIKREVTDKYKVRLSDEEKPNFFVIEGPIIGVAKPFNQDFLVSTSTFNSLMLQAKTFINTKLAAPTAASATPATELKINAGDIEKTLDDIDKNCKGKEDIKIDVSEKISGGKAPYSLSWKKTEGKTVKLSYDNILSQKDVLKIDACNLHSKGAGVYKFEATVTDADGKKASQTYTLNIKAATAAPATTTPAAPAETKLTDEEEGWIILLTGKIYDQQNKEKCAVLAAKIKLGTASDADKTTARTFSDNHNLLAAGKFGLEGSACTNNVQDENLKYNIRVDCNNPSQFLVWKNDEAPSPIIFNKATFASNIGDALTQKGFSTVYAGGACKNVSDVVTASQPPAPLTGTTGDNKNVQALAGGGIYTLLKDYLKVWKDSGAKKMTEKWWDDCKKELIACFFTSTSILKSLDDVTRLVYNGGDMASGRCSGESVLPGNSACEKCSVDNFMLCTESRCLKLGNCMYQFSAEQDKGLCLPKECGEGEAAVTKIKLNWTAGESAGTRWDGFVSPEATRDSSKKTILRISKKVPYKLTSMKISVDTDVYSVCRYGIDSAGKDKEFDNMANGIGSSDWSKKHETEIALPSGIGRGQNHSVYIKCENQCEEKTLAQFNDYRIDLEIEEVPDSQAPAIIEESLDPSDKYFYSSQTKEVDFSFTLSENGYCKYSTASDSNDLTTNWDEMEIMAIQSVSGAYTNPQNSASPKDARKYSTGNISVKQAYCDRNAQCKLTTNKNCAKCYMKLDLTKGYNEINWSAVDYDKAGINPTAAQMSQISNELNGTSRWYTIALRCADYGSTTKGASMAGQANPDVSENATDDNIMAEDDAYSYTVKTADPYTLNIKSPVGSVDEKSVSIEIESGRSTKCRYSIDNESSFDDMPKIDYDAVDKKHKTEISGSNLADKNKHVLYVKCLDMVNLLQSKSQEFNVIADTYAPVITRAYKSLDNMGELLEIRTNEEARCVYNTREDIKCNYNFEEGIGMTSMDTESGRGTQHFSIWTSDKTYYIKCKDSKQIGPIARTCTRIIRPYTI